MQYAIIQIQSHQYMVKPGTKITVDATVGEPGKAYTNFQILAIKDTNLSLGQPALDNTLVLTVQEHLKGPKVVSRTYKAKSRYRKTIGHRQPQTILTVDTKRTAKPVSPAKPKSAPTAKKAAKA